MSKRNVATVLWFAMGWTIGSIIAIAIGLPSIFGIVMGIPFAWVIRTGPAARVWTTRVYTGLPETTGMPAGQLTTE